MKTCSIKKLLVSSLVDGAAWFVSSGYFFYATLIVAFVGIFSIRSDLVVVLSIIGWPLVNAMAYTLIEAYVVEPRRLKRQAEQDDFIKQSLARLA